MFFKEKNEVTQGEKMGITMAIAIAQKMKISPKDLADSIVTSLEGDYLAQFTVEFARATTEAMVDKLKTKKTKK